MALSAEETDVAQLDEKSIKMFYFKKKLKTHKHFYLASICQTFKLLDDASKDFKSILIYFIQKFLGTLLNITFIFMYVLPNNQPTSI